MRAATHIRRLALLAVLLTCGFWPGEALAGRTKLDTQLRALVDAGSTATHRVIIRAVPGKRSALKTRLSKKKEPVLREFTKIDAVVSNVPGTDLLALSDDASVGSISIDAPLKAHAEHVAQ
jgi:hypothetical protein